MRNLTPHAIVIYDDDGNKVATVPPSGEVARVTCESLLSHVTNGVSFFTTQYGVVEGLPQPHDEILIVSALVRQAMPHRADLASPGELIRNDQGQPIGCRGLVVSQPRSVE